MPAIAYSMAGHGWLEMAGILHVLCAGNYGLLLSMFFKYRRQQSSPCKKDMTQHESS
jgi:hypothetical protein